MSVIIASQFEDAFNEELRGHPSRPIIIDAPEDTPWEAADNADIMLVRPSPAWRSSQELERPKAWPGRVKWVYSGSAGVDFYPRWMLDAPLVSCGRGVASDEIADYVIAAIYAQAKNIQAVQAHSPEEWLQAELGRVAGTTVGVIGLGPSARRWRGGRLASA